MADMFATDLYRSKRKTRSYINTLWINVSERLSRHQDLTDEIRRRVDQLNERLGTTEQEIERHHTESAGTINHLRERIGRERGETEQHSRNEINNLRNLEISPIRINVATVQQDIRSTREDIVEFRHQLTTLTDVTTRLAGQFNDLNNILDQLRGQIPDIVHHTLDPRITEVDNRRVSLDSKVQELERGQLRDIYTHVNEVDARIQTIDNNINRRLDEINGNMQRNEDRRSASFQRESDHVNVRLEGLRRDMDKQKQRIRGIIQQRDTICCVIL